MQLTCSLRPRSLLDAPASAVLGACPNKTSRDRQAKVQKRKAIEMKIDITMEQWTVLPRRLATKTLRAFPCRIYGGSNSATVNQHAGHSVPTAPR